MTIEKSIAGHGIFSSFKDDEAIKLIEFFLYYAAPVNTSPLSLDLSTSLNDADKGILVSSLLSECGCSKTDFIFIAFADRRESDLERLKLTDELFVADRSKGFFWRDVPNSKQKARGAEHEFDCITRHIRNSIAHGRISNKGGYALMEDKSKKTITMRLLIKPSVLLKWSESIQERFDK